MRLKARAVVFVLAGLLMVSCDDGDSGKGQETERRCDPATYVEACHADMTRYYACNGGVVALVDCPTRCNGETGKCYEPCGSDFAPSCANGARTVCDNGLVKYEPCGADEVCEGGVCKAGNLCTEADYPAHCSDDRTRAYCEGGVKKEMSCGADEMCVGGECKAKAVEAACTFTARCEGASVLATCEDGKITRTLCKGGAICNASLKEAKCKIPAENDPCDPATFSESCRGNQAVICNSNGGKVEFFDCEKNYGKSRCDIMENYEGTGLSTVMCTLSDGGCSVIGETKSECTAGDPDPEDPDWTIFYETTYECGKFALGNYFYIVSEARCSGTCDSEKRHCAPKK